MNTSSSKQSKKTWLLIVASVAVLTVLAGLVFTVFLPREDEKKTPVYTYNINEKYPHDPSAFTQGFIYKNGYFYESTGRYGESDIRKVDPESGEVLHSHKLDDRFFGEGLTALDGKLFQLTWKSGKVFVYDKNFLQTDSFQIPGEGWGLTNDGEHLIQSDGSDILYFLDPVNLYRVSQVFVYDENGPVDNINELQYIDGLVYANIWHTYKIAVIDPSEGAVQFWIDCTGIIDTQDYPDIDVMNGIAYDKEQDRLFVTGKLWPYVYDISVGNYSGVTW